MARHRPHRDRRASRRFLVITAVTGLNGAGKTSYAAGLLQRWNAKGIKTAANIGVRGSQLVRNFDELLELRDCVLLVDEVTAVASSRQFASLTPEALLFFQTLRHSNIGLIWTAPTYDRCDLALRSLTLYWVHLSPLIRSIPKGGIWANTHVSFVRGGRPMEGMDGAKMLAPMPSLYLPARHHAVYDSFADVDLFTRSQRFPSRCPGCGVSLDYGRLKASTEPSGATFDASFYCPQCDALLGTVNRPRSDQAELHRLETSSVNPPTDTPSRRGPEDLPGDFEKLLGIEGAFRDRSR